MTELENFPQLGELNNPSELPTIPWSYPVKFNFFYGKVIWNKSFSMLCTCVQQCCNLQTEPYCQLSHYCQLLAEKVSCNLITGSLLREMSHEI